jgi:cytochrome c oxidase cbb3-type subunit 3
MSRLQPGPSAASAAEAAASAASPASAASEPRPAEAASQPPTALSLPPVQDPAPTGTVVPMSVIRNVDEHRAYDANEGKRLFRWFNCNGCHSNGGGGMGPPLMDSTWIYGSAPSQVAATILQGRPNGMPSFAGRLSDEQLWQLVAYVRSMSGLVRMDVAPTRNDTLNAGKPESQRAFQKPYASAPKP